MGKDYMLDGSLRKSRDEEESAANVRKSRAETSRREP